MTEITALRGPVPGPPPSGSPAAMRPAGAGPEFRAPRGDDRLLHALPARAFAFFALLAFGAVHWMRMVEPPAPERAWYAAAAAAVVAAGLVLAARLRGPWRAAACVATLAGGVAIAIVSAGVADELLKPARWGALADGIARGIEALPGARVPYRGLDEWLRAVIPMGGTMLAVLAAALAFWPRRHGRTGFVVPALVALVTLYAVPAVALIFESEFLRGAALALLVIAFLRLERLRRRDAPAAAAVGATAAILALAVAPAIDGLDPWWDYETWALSAASSRSTTFAWDHDYGPLSWPRDGRELLRVKAKQRAYWKADQLDDFDGTHWVRGNSANSGRVTDAFLTDGIDTRRLVRWEQEISVSVRSLRSETFVTAGTVQLIRMPGRAPVQTERLGIFRTSRTLRRGDAYRATVYLPTPDPAEMRAAPINDLGITELQQFRRFDLFSPEEQFGPGTPANTVVVRRFKANPVVPGLDGIDVPATELIENSPQARIWELARELRRGARTPYDYLRRVERYLGAERFSYAERPPEEAATLDGFLFDARVGYCQQYSGAMALLLRMGGVPARVATGFSPGSLNQKTGEFVVRDYDAHSWVEAWFAGIGWVPFDPTPTSAPPRSQATSTALGSAALGDVSDLGTTTLDPRAAAADSGGGFPWALVAAVLAALVALALTARHVRRRLHRAQRPAVLELERALRITAGGVAPATTLSALESRFAGAPSALGYLRALRAQRFAPAGPGPTAAQRRALRAALARGHGPLGRLRSWWALPPRVRG